MKLGIPMTTMDTIIVGVNLIPAAEEVKSALTDILVYIFVAIVILGAVAWIGYGTSEEEEKKEPSAVIIATQSYIKEHRKQLIIVGAVTFAFLLIWLSTLGGYRP